MGWKKYLMKANFKELELDVVVGGAEAPETLVPLFVVILFEFQTPY